MEVCEPLLSKAVEEGSPGSSLRPTIAHPYGACLLTAGLSLSLPSSPWATCCETDGWGRVDRQTEGSREREAKNYKVVKWETISRSTSEDERCPSRGLWDLHHSLSERQNKPWTGCYNSI
ncbi:hypothetical protein AMECASPLE_004819 [Ameca splendens]|uniref:Uncharacterized protein n=1 Tax=Ameca splendens TaxID=208324 RepID=A0ABV0ZKU8_9TELE